MNGDSQGGRAAPAIGGGPVVLLGLALFLAILCFGMVGVRRVGGGDIFAADAAYSDLAIASRVATHGQWALAEGQPVPATTGSVWRVLLAWLQRLTPGTAAPLLAGALSGIIALLGTFAMARALPRGDSFAGLAVVLAAAGAALPTVALSGLPGAFGAGLVALAWALHVRAAAWGDIPLSISSALLLAISAANQVETAILWPVMLIHGLLVALFSRGWGRRFLATLLRGVSGALLIGAALLPLLFWNRELAGTGVPWPRFPDAPVSLNDLAGAAAASYGSLVREGIAIAYARAFEIPLLRQPLVWAFALAGLIAGFRGGDDTRRGAATTAFSASLLLPLCFAAGYPLYGTSALDAILVAPAVSVATLAAFGCVAAGGWIVALVPGIRLPGPVSSRTAIALAAFAVVLAPSLFLARADVQRDLAALESAQRVRQEARDALATTEQGVIASEQVGWLAWSLRARTVDLGGALAPSALAYRPSGPWTADALSACLDAGGATHVLIWPGNNTGLADALGCDAPTLAPVVCPVTRAAGP